MNILFNDIKEKFNAELLKTQTISEKFVNDTINSLDIKSFIPNKTESIFVKNIDENDIRLQPFMKEVCYAFDYTLEEYKTKDNSSFYYITRPFLGDLILIENNGLFFYNIEEEYLKNISTNEVLSKGKNVYAGSIIALYLNNDYRLNITHINPHKPEKTIKIDLDEILITKDNQCSCIINNCLNNNIKKININTVESKENFLNCAHSFNKDNYVNMYILKQKESGLVYKYRPSESATVLKFSNNDDIWTFFVHYENEKLKEINISCDEYMLIKYKDNQTYINNMGVGDRDEPIENIKEYLSLLSLSHNKHEFLLPLIEFFDINNIYLFEKNLKQHTNKIKDFFNTAIHSKSIEEKHNFLNELINFYKKFIIEPHVIKQNLKKENELNLFNKI